MTGVAEARIIAMMRVLLAYGCRMKLTVTAILLLNFFVTAQTITDLQLLTSDQVMHS